MILEEKVKEMFVACGFRPSKDEIVIYSRILEKQDQDRVFRAINAIIENPPDSRPSVSNIIKTVRGVTDHQEINPLAFKILQIDKTRPHVWVRCSVTNQKFPMYLSLKDMESRYENCRYTDLWTNLETAKMKVPPCIHDAIGRIKDSPCNTQDEWNCFKRCVGIKKIRDLAGAQRGME